MRFLLCICCVAFVLNCENKQSTKKTATKIPVKVEEKKDITKDTLEAPKREYPLLTEDNAMEFFLQYDKHHKEDKVRITTDYGIIDIQLFEKTKFHRSNFIYLTKNKIFDGTQFYRVVKNFIIQGGNTDDPKIIKKRKTIGKYLLPRDTKRGYKHHYGMVSMPSSDAVTNPHKLASPFEFFIVQNKKGSYHLDGDYTIFGKVIRGMDVVDEIANQPTDSREWPLNNVYINKVEIID